MYKLKVSATNENGWNVKHIDEKKNEIPLPDQEERDRILAQNLQAHEIDKYELLQAKEERRRRLFKHGVINKHDVNVFFTPGDAEKKRLEEERDRLLAEKLQRNEEREVAISRQKEEEEKNIARMRELSRQNTELKRHNSTPLHQQQKYQQRTRSRTDMAFSSMRNVRQPQENTRHPQENTRHSQSIRHSQENTRHSQESIRHSQENARHSQENTRHSQESRNHKNIRHSQENIHRQQENIHRQQENIYLKPIDGIANSAAREEANGKNIHYGNLAKRQTSSYNAIWRDQQTMFETHTKSSPYENVFEQPSPNNNLSSRMGEYNNLKPSLEPSIKQQNETNTQYENLFNQFGDLTLTKPKSHPYENRPCFPVNRDENTYTNTSHVTYHNTDEVTSPRLPYNTQPRVPYENINNNNYENTIIKRL